MYSNNRDMYYNPYYSQNYLHQGSSYNPYYSQNYLYYGPSPVIPFLLVVFLGLLISSESIQQYYDIFEVTENVEESSETLPITVIAIIFVAVLSGGFMCNNVVTVVPIAMLLSVFLLQNEVLCILLLILILSFSAMYSYPSQNRGYYQRGYYQDGWNSDWSRPVYQSRWDQFNNEEPNERRSDLPFSLTPGQLCYMMMVGCLASCTVDSDSEDQNIMWICMTFILLCILYISFSGRGNREWML